MKFNWEVNSGMIKKELMEGQGESERGKGKSPVKTLMKFVSDCWTFIAIKTSVRQYRAVLLDFQKGELPRTFLVDSRKISINLNASFIKCYTHALMTGSAHLSTLFLIMYRNLSESDSMILNYIFSSTSYCRR